MGAESDPDLESRLAALEARVAELELEVRVSELAAERSQQRAASTAQAPPPPTGPASPPPPSAPPSWPQADVPLWLGGKTSKERTTSWAEQITTEVALKWAGLGLLFLAAVFLVSTAVSRGWIGPELQLAGAVALGLILVALALRFTSSFPLWAQSFAVAGVAVLFTSAGAASEWLDLGGVGSGTVATIAVTVLGVGLSRQFSWLAVAFVSFFGSLLVLEWIGAPDEYGTSGAFTFALALVFHLLYVYRSWPILYLVVGATLLLVQFSAVNDQDEIARAQTFLTGAGLVHWAAPVAHRFWNRDSDEMSRLAARLVLVVPAWVWFGTVVLHDMDTGPALAVAVAVAVIAAATALMLRNTVPLWLWATQLLAASVAISVGLIFWLEGSTLLGALAAQALAMLYLATKLDDTWFWWQSVLTAAAVLIVTLGLTIEAIDVNATWGADVIHLLVLSAAFAIGWLERKSDSGTVISLGAYVGVMLWVASVFIHFGQGQFIISAVWAAIGVAIVVIGLANQNISVARVGLATLVVVVGKLLSVDLSEVDTFWRAGLFFVIGLGFLWLSYSVPGLVGRGESADTDVDETVDSTP